MKKFRLLVIIVLSVCGVFVFTSKSFAQITKDIYQTDYTIDPEEKGKLYIKFDNVSFFKNNEFKGNYLKGYTLPGFWLQAKGVFYPLKNIKLEGGLYALRFWGANKYPSFAYSDITTWKGEQFQHNLHTLPFLRVHFQLGKGFHAVIGNLYGGANHNLIEPLYNPEMNLISDPESGVQLIYNSRFFDTDVWINWESFIFEMDNHQEAFTVGVSSRFKYNDSKSPVHFYSPFQVVGQHRGGEIDSYRGVVQMLFNGVAGVGATANFNEGILKKMDMGVNFVGFYKQKGDLTPFEKGFGIHTQASIDLGKFRVKGAYWIAKDFVTLFGNPIFGTVSTSEENFYFDKPRTMHLGGEFHHKLGKGYSLGVDLDVFHHFPVYVNSPEGRFQQEAATSLTFGVYFRINPAFLLKKF